MNVRSVLKWLLVLVFLLAAVIGGAVWQMWRRSDQLLYDQILAQLEEQAPDWDVTLGNARFDWQNQSRVYLSHLRLQPPGAEEPMVVVPAAVVYLDGDLLRDNMQILIRKVLIQDCRIHAVRHPDGSWNLDELRTLKSDPDDVSFPELHLNQASIQLDLQHSESSPATKLFADQVNIRCIPGGKKLYQLQGTAEISRLGRLQLQGELDLQHGRWELNGRVGDLTAGRDLLEWAADVAPDVQKKLERIDDRLRGMCTHAEHSDPLSFERALEEPARDRAHFQNLVHSDADSTGYAPLVNVEPLTSGAADSNRIPDFGLSGEMQVDFRVGQTRPDSKLDYTLLVKLTKAQLENPLLPFPLRQLNATVYLNRELVQVRELSAVNGETNVTMSANVEIHGLTTPGTFRVRVERLPISARLKQLVDAPLQKLYDELNPTGVMSVSGTFRYDGIGHWTQSDVIYEFAEGSVLFEEFQYPVHDISGTIVPHPQPDGHLLFEHHFRGFAGQRPVVLDGWNRKTDRGEQAMFHIDCKQLPIDERFIAACDPKVQKALRALNPHGKTDLHVSFFRTPEREKGYDHTIDLDVSDGSIEYERFPYPVRDLTGRFSFRSAENLWLIEDVRGKHGDATVTASGTINRQRDPERLELSVNLIDAAMDHQLEHAMRKVVPRMWEELSPSGQVTAKSKFVWIPDWDYLDVDLPSITVRDGSLMLKSFRYPFEKVQAQLSYDDKRITIHKLEAWHDETRLTGAGEYQLETDDLWRLTFDELEVWDLPPDRQFRNALPDAMAKGIDTLSPEGSVTLNARAFELRGSQSDPQIPVTAAWDLEGFVAGMDLTAGLELSDVHGKFTSSGTWDGRWVNANGSVDLDSAFCLEQHLKKVRGRFRISHEDGRQVLVVGSEGSLKGAPRLKADPHPLTAQVIGGTVYLDAKVILGDQTRDIYGRMEGEPTRYQAYVELSDGRLQEFTRRNFAGGGNLKGVVNGMMNLRGTGDSASGLTGDGSVVIAPAALYELPVIFKIFQGLNITAPPDQAAFDEAILNFEIANERFKFSRIDLLGNSLSLRGRGQVRFDRKVDLEFFSVVPKTQPVIPIIKELYQTASYGWVYVKVNGSVAQPRTKVKTNFVLDKFARDFLYSFQPFRPIIDGMTPPESAKPSGSRSSQVPLPPRQ